MKKVLFLGACVLALMAASCSSDDGLEDKGKDKDKGKINGHEYVDLGLPSGTKWATMNVGAASPEEYGDYYAWGETETKGDYSWVTYLTCGTMSSEKDCGTSKDPWKDYVYPKCKSIAGTNYDVAHVKWGGTWKMPTKEQIEELLSYCASTWTDNYNETGVAGLIITSTVYKYKSIFLPAAGYRGGSIVYRQGSDCCYWSATPSSGSASRACSLDFGSGGIGWYGDDRYFGQPVRPVSE